MKKTPAPTPKQPEISPLDWVGDPEKCPKYVGFPTRNGLPPVLIWSGEGQVPAIGARVHIYMNSFGPAVVKAYFHADGYLGVLCAPEVLPDWFQRQSPGVTLVHIFGRELEPYGPKPTPATAAAPAPDKEHPLAEWAAAIDQAHEANDNKPAINDPGDWIPDYPETANPDDNQDSEDYPEHPQDEQRD
ncbi:MULTISPECIES: hypothetical protein [Hymenobacter]|uniref:Uncharacterized protein n=1 Tax=Hymenobacter mucosus TaxID=1411120 RepID=A0A239BBE1_9BACT|nr:MULTISPECIES: hypothetical protein [Hymenobacter]MDF7815488.1 hypothetical protein [Hymenobacter sp. YC55]SNS05305.1 hypothetical protein SAMN06269173_12112 [Hymenobacter mucosus]